MFSFWPHFYEVLTSSQYCLTAKFIGTCVTIGVLSATPYMLGLQDVKEEIRDLCEFFVTSLRNNSPLFSALPEHSVPIISTLLGAGADKSLKALCWGAAGPIMITWAVPAAQMALQTPLFPIS